MIISNQKAKYKSANCNKNMFYDNYVYQDIKTTNIDNKILKTQSYFIIKFIKLYFLLNMILLFMKLLFPYCECTKENILFKSSEVTLKIKGTGNIKFFYDSFFQIYNHCEIHLNDSFYITEKNEYYFYPNINLENNDINFVKIIWNDTILSTRNMFENCTKIIEMDLSNFDTSNVSSMSKMFYGCS